MFDCPWFTVSDSLSIEILRRIVYLHSDLDAWNDTRSNTTYIPHETQQFSFHLRFYVNANDTDEAWMGNLQTSNGQLMSMERYLSSKFVDLISFKMTELNLLMRLHTNYILSSVVSE